MACSVGVSEVWMLGDEDQNDDGDDDDQEGGDLIRARVSKGVTHRCS